RPFVVEDRLINLAAVPDAAAAAFEATPPGTWLLQQTPWTEAEHRIRAVRASKAAAETLHVPAGAPCLVIERTTWRSGVPVTSVVLTYPGDRHELTARFNPAGKRGQASFPGVRRRTKKGSGVISGGDGLVPEGTGNDACPLFVSAARPRK